MDMTLEKAPFTTGDLVVYPTHGVGKIVGIETQEIAGKPVTLVSTEGTYTSGGMAGGPTRNGTTL